MCGIIGILSHTPVNQEIYDGLLVLQHRGQDAAGMVTSDGKRLYIRRKNGLVTDVFRKEHMKRLYWPSTLPYCRLLIEFRSATFLCEFTLRSFTSAQW